MPPNSHENLLPPSAETQSRAISEPAHCDKIAGGEVSGGRAGRSDCGDHDDLMEQMSGNGAEKSPESPASVAVSCANIDKPVLIFRFFCMILSQIICFSLLL